ncbi:MAG: alkyl hydroperoxide reductase [Steroidobacteraceae bacterium]|nr:alkyl hydroperoxide reductase [Steroidobacteraceae bacterium]
MTIKTGDRIPEGKLKVMGKEGPMNVSAEELLGNGRVVLFSVPGAFTPTCDAKHLPGFVQQAGALRAKGVGKLVCLAVNDVFVMNAWGKAAGVGEAIVMAADGNGDYSRALGLELDARGHGMGMRGKRFALVIEDGVAKQVHVEAPGEFRVVDGPAWVVVDRAVLQCRAGAATLSRETGCRQRRGHAAGRAGTGQFFGVRAARGGAARTSGTFRHADRRRARCGYPAGHKPAPACLGVVP